MKAYLLDDGMNRVLFARDTVEVSLGKNITDRVAAEYAQAAEAFLGEHPSTDLVVVEWREVKFAAGLAR